MYVISFFLLLAVTPGVASDSLHMDSSILPPPIFLIVGFLNSLLMDWPIPIRYIMMRAPFQFLGILIWIVILHLLVV